LLSKRTVFLYCYRFKFNQLILQAASGRREDIKNFGDDYETDDGTCVRDYIHINDLCEAHSLALKKMIADDRNARYNLGNGSVYLQYHF